MRLTLIPSARTLWLLLAASFLLLVDTGLALAVDALILALAFVDGRRTPAPSAEREVPRISALAAVTEVALTVTNPAGRAVTVRVTDDLDPCLRRVGGADGVDPWEAGLEIGIPARSSAACPYRVTPRTRGFLALGTVHLRTLSPWGLAWRRSSVEVSDILQVQPGVRDLLRSRSGHAIHRRLRTPGQRRNRQWGEGREFESLRDYAQGTIPGPSTGRRRRSGASTWCATTRRSGARTSSWRSTRAGTCGSACRRCANGSTTRSGHA